MLICVTVLILKHDLFNYFHIGNVNTQNNVDEPGPQLVAEPPPQGLFPLSEFGMAHWGHTEQLYKCQSLCITTVMSAYKVPLHCVRKRDYHTVFSQYTQYVRHSHSCNAIFNINRVTHTQSMWKNQCYNIE